MSGDDRARWLQKLVAENGSGFTLNDITTRSSGFFGGSQPAVFSLYSGREIRKGLDGRTINYFVYELKRKLTAEKAGTYAFGPAIVKGSFVDGLEGGTYTPKRVVAIAPLVPAEVRDVPVPRPRRTAAESAITAWRRPPAPLRCGWATRSLSRSTSNVANRVDRSN